LDLHRDHCRNADCLGWLGAELSLGRHLARHGCNATRIEKERDCKFASKPEDRDAKKELDTLNTIILDITKNFSQKVLDREVKAKESTSPNGLRKAVWVSYFSITKQKFLKPCPKSGRGGNYTSIAILTCVKTPSGSHFTNS